MGLSLILDLMQQGTWKSASQQCMVWQYRIGAQWILQADLLRLRAAVLQLWHALLSLDLDTHAATRNLGFSLFILYVHLMVAVM